MTSFPINISSNWDMLGTCELPIMQFGLMEHSSWTMDVVRQNLMRHFLDILFLYDEESRKYSTLINNNLLVTGLKPILLEFH